MRSFVEEDEYSEAGEKCHKCWAPNEVNTCRDTCRPPYSCPSGYYCPDGECEKTDDCARCPVGQMSDDSTWSTCLPCSEPGEVSNEGQNACVKCLPGQQPAGNGSRCDSCEGTTFSTYGIACTPCGEPNVVKLDQDSNNHIMVKPHIGCGPCLARALLLGHG